VTCGALNVSPRLHSCLPLVPDLTVNDLVITPETCPHNDYCSQDHYHRSCWGNPMFSADPVTLV